jgi:hypothetical protein
MSRTRIPNKLIWGLEDILACCLDARDAWRQAHRRARQQMDPVMLAALATLSDRLAEIERRARDARNGEYDQRVVAGAGKDS